MRILLAGKHELACELFETIYGKGGHQLGVVVCQSEDLTIRGRRCLKKLLLKYRFKPLNQSFSHAELLAVVKNFRPDLLISAGFDKIIKPQVIDLVPHCVNIHFGLLPAYRGNFSIPWAILNNEKFIGVTLHKINSIIDGGEIIVQQKIANDQNKSCRQLYLQACEVGVDLVAQFIDDLVARKPIKYTDQKPQEAGYFGKIPHEDFKINWRKSTLAIVNLIRALYFPPYEGAYTIINGLTISIEFPVKFKLIVPTRSAGTIWSVGGSWWVATLDGWIGPQTIVFAGRKYKFSRLAREKKFK